MTGRVRGVPPGRTGRLWLRQRLETARRGSSLLDRKLHLLLGVQDRLHAAELRTREDWGSRCAQAQALLLRAALLHGRRAITLAAARREAAVSVSYGQVAGTRYPTGATCVAPGPMTYEPATVAAARMAFGAAVAAAARHAAAAAAVRTIDADIDATRYRLRAIEDRWIPRLEDALRQVELGLEELEHADGVRLRQLLSQPGER